MEWIEERLCELLRSKCKSQRFLELYRSGTGVEGRSAFLFNPCSAAYPVPITHSNISIEYGICIPNCVQIFRMWVNIQFPNACSLWSMTVFDSSTMQRANTFSGSSRLVILLIIAHCQNIVWLGLRCNCLAYCCFVVFFCWKCFHPTSIFGRVCSRSDSANGSKCRKSDSQTNSLDHNASRNPIFLHKLEEIHVVIIYVYVFMWE